MPLHTFTSLRTTDPSSSVLLAQLRALDASAACFPEPGSRSYVVKKGSAWTAQQIAAVQSLIDNAVANSPQLTAQTEIDNWPLSLQALVLTLIDQLNVLRAALPSPLAAITPAQALTAVRTKAGTL